MTLQRLAVVVPPEEWFRGWPLYAYYETCRRALADLGVATIDVPMRVFLEPFDLSRNADMLGELRAFRPQAAIALHIGTFLMHCRLPPDRDGWRPHFLTDLLDIPTIAIWDHAPFDFATAFLDGGTQASPEVSRPGALSDLRRALCHRRLIHWSRDSGQSRVMVDLGLARSPQLFHEPSATFPDFMRQAAEPADDGVCFVGYLKQNLPPWSDPALDDVAREVVAHWLNQAAQPAWDSLRERIAALPSAERASLALDPDQSFFWAFANRVIREQAHSARRLRVLGAVGRPVTVYGNLDPAGAPANLTSVPGYIPPGAPLAELFARHAITIDVLNPGFVNGYGHKPALCFAAGGFMLLDHKHDFVEAFGEIGEAVSWRSADELAAKVDLYLSRPRLRAELAAAMREKIAAHHTLHASLERGLSRAAEIAARPAPPPISRSVDHLDLLPSLRRWGGWPRQHWPLRRSDSGVEITSNAADGTFTARLVLPATVAAMRQPHLRLTLQTRAGRLGVGVRYDPSMTLDREQDVGCSRYPVTFDFELPEGHRPEVILRTRSDAPVHAVLSELVLCDRPS